MKNLIPSFLRLRLSVFGAGLIMLTAAAAAVWMRSATAGRAPISTGAPARYDSSKGIIPAALTMTVNSLGDADDINIGDGICDSDAGTAGNQCTLRAAIQETNAAAAGDDVINFSLPAGNPITLNSALPDIGGNLAINGPGAATLTVQRNPAAGTPDFRIFNIGLGTTVSVSGLTVANGKLTGANNGGGVINQGALTLTNCDFFGNAAQDGGAIFNNGTSLILVGCHVGGTLAGQANTALGAGGIWHNSGTLTMTGGSVVGNTGGAMFAGQPVTLDSVAITDNVNDGRGGGIFVFNSSTIVKCLIAKLKHRRGGWGRHLLSGRHQYSREYHNLRECG
jgi:CSLREA domain-containing protein